jgi:hypothetical protein
MTVCRVSTFPVRLSRWDSDEIHMSLCISNNSNENSCLLGSDTLHCVSSNPVTGTLTKCQGDCNCNTDCKHGLVYFHCVGNDPAPGSTGDKL